MVKAIKRSYFIDILKPARYNNDISAKEIFMKKMRVSTRFIHSFPMDDYSEYIRRGLEFNKNAGFDAIDIYMGFKFLEKAQESTIETALSDAEKIGIKFEIAHLPFSSRVCKEPDFLPLFNERMHEAIDYAKLFGVEYAVFHPNTTTLAMSKYDRREEFNSVIAHLSPFVEHAERVGVKVVIENMRQVPLFIPTHRYCQMPDELCEVADALGIGVCWDFGHAHISGIKQSEGLAYVGKRLKVLHINDNYATDDEHIPPFMGTIDWRDAMHGLALAEFDGLLNFELHHEKIPDTAREAYAKYIIDSARVLESYIE